MAWVSAVGPLDPESGEVRSADIRKQTRQCLENVSRHLAALGSSFDRVVWATWSLREPSDFDAFYEEWMRWAEGEPPVGQSTLMPLSQRRAGFRVSVGVIAATQEGRFRDASRDDLALLPVLRPPVTTGQPPDAPCVVG
jgi:enamine deaminase RidA (YjgF/YER057c/UK114 family)